MLYLLKSDLRGIETIEVIHNRKAVNVLKSDLRGIETALSIEAAADFMEC